LSPEYIDRIRTELPELPPAKTRRFRADYGLGAIDARRLTLSPDIADYYEAVAKTTRQPKLTANWMIGDLTAALNRDGLEIAQCPIRPDDLATLIHRIVDGTLSGKMAKMVFESVWRGEGDPTSIIENQGLSQLTDAETIENIVDKVLDDHPIQVSQFRSGKKKLLGYFVGQVMKITRGKANPEKVNQALRRKL